MLSVLRQIRIGNRIAAAVCFLVVGGSIIGHAAYAVRLRGDPYRRRVEEKVAAYFDMPCNIREVSLRTYSERAFDGLEIWLPDRRDRVFQCERAIWREFTENSLPRVDLDLLNGTLALGTDAWKLEDYRRVLESGLRHDFDELRQVRLDAFNITYRRRSLLITVREAGGSITFKTPDVGVTALQAYELNGRRVAEPIRIHATFLPRGEALVSDMTLEIPEVALAGLSLDAAVGAPLTRGTFSGRLTYREHNPEPLVTLSGRLADVDLAELTARLPTGTIRGSAEVTLDSAEFLGALPTRVQGRGRLQGVQIADLARLAGQQDMPGFAELNVSDAIIETGHIRRLVVNGRAEGLELVDLLRPLGKGKATGRLSVVVNALRIENDRIVSADIDVLAAPLPGEQGTIDRDLFLAAAQDLAGFSLPDALPRRLLPEQIEYTQFGMRLLVTDNRLRVLGTHGTDNQTILTIRLFGTEWGVVKQWGDTIDLTPWVELVLERAGQVDPRDVPAWLRAP